MPSARDRADATTPSIPASSRWRRCSERWLPTESGRRIETWPTQSSSRLAFRYTAASFSSKKPSGRSRAQTHRDIEVVISLDGPDPASRAVVRAVPRGFALPARRSAGKAGMGRQHQLADVAGDGRVLVLPPAGRSGRSALCRSASRVRPPNAGSRRRLSATSWPSDLSDCRLAQPSVTGSPSARQLALLLRASSCGRVSRPDPCRSASSLGRNPAQRGRELLGRYHLDGRRSRAGVTCGACRSSCTESDITPKTST